jgi:hypothetical protein
MQSVPGNFWEWTSSLGSGERVAIIILGIFAIVFVITIVAGTVHKIHKNRLDDALKRELLDRGVSADEIATIVNRPASKCGSKR